MVLYLLPVPGIFSTLVADTVQYDDDHIWQELLTSISNV